MNFKFQDLLKNILHISNRFPVDLCIFKKMTYLWEALEFQVHWVDFKEMWAKIKPQFLEYLLGLVWAKLDLLVDSL